MMKDMEKYTDFLFYNSEDGTIKVQVIADKETETIWTTQKGMSEIFGVEVPAISKHLKNIFETGELEERVTVSKMEIVQTEGNRNVKRLKEVYNLDVIIAVGYRVNSIKATRFRIWATKVLREYLIKGFALDDERLKKGGKLFDRNYFDELLERIREIRASERMFYQKPFLHEKISAKRQQEIATAMKTLCKMVKENRISDVSPWIFLAITIQRLI